MSSFTTPLIVSPLPDGRNWRLVHSFTYHVGTKYSKNKITVPRNFITDFASIPWIFWALLPYWGKYGKAAIIHDYLYSTHQVSRRMTDLIFYEAMLVGGTTKWKAIVMYWAVHLFGWLAWH